MQYLAHSFSNPLILIHISLNNVAVFDVMNTIIVLLKGFEGAESDDEVNKGRVGHVLERVTF